METTLLSVIIPVYNVESYLSSCLDSILNQSYRNIEVVLIDDGSTDGSGEICDIYATTDTRVYVSHIPNGGVSAARNLGMSKAKGEWVTFVDADDLVPQDTFLNCVQIAEKENVDIVMTQMRFELNPEGTETLTSETPSIVNRYKESAIKEKYIRKTIKNFNLSFWGKVYHKSLLFNVFFPKGVSNYEDYVTLWQVAQRCPSYSIIDHVGYVARCRPESVSRKCDGLITYRKRIKSLIYACEKMDEYFKDADSIRKDLTKFIIVEGLACKKLYEGFSNNDKEEILLLTSDLWDTMKHTCIMPWYMRLLLSLRVKMLNYNINGYPIWQYGPVRLALRSS